MSYVLEKKNRERQVINNISDSLFFVLLVSNYLFQHSLLSQLGMGLFVIFIAVRCILIGRIRISYYFFFFFLFLAYNYINVKQGYSVAPLTSLKMIKSLGISFVLFLFLYNYIILRDNIEKVLRIFVSSTLIFALIVIMLSLPTIFTQRLGSGTDYNSNMLALVSSISLIILLYEYLTVKTKRKFNLMLICSLLGVVILTGSRKGLLMICVGIVILLYLLYPNKRLRNFIIGSFSIIILYFSIMNIPVFYNIIGVRIEVLLDHFISKQQVKEESLSDRMDLISIGLSYIEQSPIRGYGIDTFKLLPESMGFYSHNNYVELLYSGGIIAFILFYINYLIALIISIYNSIKGDSLSKLMTAILISVLIIEYGYVSYYDRSTLFVGVIVIGYSKILSNKKQKNKANIKVGGK